ncbi:C2 domain-containing protein [Heracleum sosnowskyi]|uniref:C2 domain-containing protein n=1 Tax=Heracleum sosnowskyi TaxID=360622 RepID=A0AAD8H739_9APIA|nr:C2 domain-containing protein [Heracleum sosnowskyi]
MEYRPLDITVISATNLKNVNMFMKMVVFVEVFISGEHEESPTTKRRTHMDRSGGCDPEWNHRFKFTVEEASILRYFINFHLKAERGLGEKVVGVVRIPLMDLLQDSIDNKTSQDTEAEYQVLTTAGKAKGSLKISFRFGEKIIQQVDAITPVKKTTAALPDMYPSPPTNGTDVGNGGYYPPPYTLHSQPGMVPGQYPVPPGYSYPGYGGGYMYPYPPNFYPPPPGVPPGYNYTGQHVTYANNPVQQPDPVQENSVEKQKILGFGINTGLGLGAGMLAGALVGGVVTETTDMALEDDLHVGET